MKNNTNEEGGKEMEKFLKVTVNGTVYDVKVEDVKMGDIKTVETSNVPVQKVKEEKVVENKVTPTSGNIKVVAPMPGNIWKIKTAIGAKVEKHEVLLILEAMKMENEIVAPEAGTVTNILVKEGDAVEPGKVMVEMA